MWDRRAIALDEPPEGATVWLGFDGSHSGDSTALVGCTNEGHIFVAGCWENPGKKGWRVPRDEVNDTVIHAMGYWNVKELVCDPPFWQREVAEWSARWPDKVTEFPTYSRARMAPATAAFYQAVMDERITHSGDKRLARHVANCVVVGGPQGDAITKQDKDSPAKIDLAVAAVLAHSRAVISVPSKQHPLAIF